MVQFVMTHVLKHLILLLLLETVICINSKKAEF